MKTDTLKKSLLDYAIKGRLSARFRRENSGFNAFDELEIYNDKIREKRKELEKELKKCEKELKLEKDKEQKAFFKSQIQSLKKELTKCKEITPLNLSKAPFEIPNSWAWVKLGDICEIFTGDSINATEKEKNFTHQTSGLNYIATKDLANDTSITYENGIKIPDEFLPSFKIAKANSTLLCIEGGSAGRKVGFLKENVCFGNKLCCFENIFAFSKFVFYFLQSGEFSKEFNSNINGIIGGVKKESIRHFLIPLPPLKEQQEIVKKLDLLVTLANDFAITKENLKRIEKSLLKLALEGSLSKLYRRNSPTLSAFDEINTYNDEIKQKRKDLEKELKTLESKLKKAPTRHCETSAGSRGKTSEAVQGVAEAGFFSNPQTKHELKSQIQILKKELTKCKEIIPLMTMDCHEVANATSRNDNLGYSSSSLRGEANHTPKTANGLPQVSSETLAMTTTPPFTIPNSWAWVKLGDICEIVSGTSYGKDDLSDEGIRILRGGNINKNSHNVDLFADDVIIKQDLTNKEKQILKNDILMIASTGSKEIIGKSAFSDVALENTQIGAFLRIIRIAKEQNAKYIFHNLISQIFATHIKSCAGGTNILNIKNEYIENFLIPLPPLQEQEYITQILDTLFTLKKGLRVD